VTDLVIAGGLLVDGTGAPARRADVAVEDGRIAAVGHVGRRGARRIVEADGLVVAPGFVDIHTHTDFTLPVFPRATALVRQGVTTNLAGNCGFSPFPVAAAHADALRDYTAFFDAGLSWSWSDLDGYRSCLESRPLALNVGMLVGHGALRVAAQGFAATAPEPATLDRMLHLLRQALTDGAFGLSLGLTYAPGRFAERRELLTLATALAPFDALLTAHVRSEAEDVASAVAEAVELARAARVPLQVSHLKAMGRPARGAVHACLEHLARARAEGLDVAADVYPYCAASTTLAIYAPAWAIEGGSATLRRRLDDDELRQRIRSDVASGASGRAFEPDTIRLGAVREGPWREAVGRTLADIAAERGEAPVDTMLDILACDPGGTKIVVTAMSEEDVVAVLRDPHTAVASDGWTLDPSASGRPHPRSFGTFPRVLGRYVRERGVLGIEAAVHKSTRLPAARMGLRDRGLVRPGWVADLVLFDRETVADAATFDHPCARPRASRTLSWPARR
jgi:N-acyl-D-amino-acid deacylase